MNSVQPVLTGCWLIGARFPRPLDLWLERSSCFPPGVCSLSIDVLSRLLSSWIGGLQAAAAAGNIRQYLSQEASKQVGNPSHWWTSLEGKPGTGRGHVTVLMGADAPQEVKDK